MTTDEVPRIPDKAGESATVDKWAVFGLVWAIGCAIYGVWRCLA